jgi:hypothetical protein
MPSIYSLGLLVLLIQFKITIVFSSASAISTTMEFGNHVIKAYQPNNITRDETSIQGSTSKADKLADKVNLPTALLDEKKRRIWCFGPNPESKVCNQNNVLLMYQISQFLTLFPHLIV